jgi:hypothetical protein
MVNAIQRRPDEHDRHPVCERVELVGRLVRGLRRVTLTVLLLCGSARAGDPWEFWPELNLYETLGATTRLYFVAAYAKGKESEYLTLDVAGYFDLTLEPIGWPSLQAKDWRRKKYLWARVGYDHVSKAEDGDTSHSEDRGIIALLARAYLPEEILVEGRARADLRWIGGDYSTRYRFRIEVNRDFHVGDRVVTPWFQAEAFYDMRYDGWARQLYQAGAEIEVTGHFKVEPSVARQVDRLPEQSGLYAVALVARWYY